MEKRLQNLEPRLIWQIFEEITSIPRPSKKEEKIRAWIREWARHNSISCKEDAVGNILLQKKASDSTKFYPTLILQAHMDMVCQKNPDVLIDFENDPIPVKISGRYVMAEGTSLGADNGIGMAYALAALITPELTPGSLEVLLTVDEETGLNGAFNISPGFFSGKYLLNLDWEKMGEIIISSAGGGNMTYMIPFTCQEKKRWTGITVAIEGLKGGHSGLDIHFSRLNAIKVLIDALSYIRDDFDLLIKKIEGGTASNSIPREAECSFIISENEKEKVLLKLMEWKNHIVEKYQKSEPDMTITISETERGMGSSTEKSEDLLALLNEIPHGPLSYNQEIGGLVQTSNNLGIVVTHEDSIEIIMHSRSSVSKELEDLRNSLHILGKTHGAQVIPGTTYPGWKSSSHTPFLSFIKDMYETISHSVSFKGVHAGLECGILSGLDPQLQLASIGPEIENAHTPRERVDIESVELIWNVIKKIIQNMGTLSH